MKWRCPYCRRELEVESPDRLPFMPFCSRRCKMAELESWFEDRYRFSRPAEEDDLGETGEADLAPPPGSRG